MPLRATGLHPIYVKDFATVPVRIYQIAMLFATSRPPGTALFGVGGNVKGATTIKQLRPQDGIFIVDFSLLPASISFFKCHFHAVDAGFEPAVLLHTTL